METGFIPRNDNLWSQSQIPLNYCVFCGNEYGNINFKGRCVCEDCLSYVKELM